MMKIIAFTIVVLFSFNSFAQHNEKININWTDGKTYQYGDFFVKIPFFDFDNLYFNSYKKELKYTLNLSITSLVDEKSLVIDNLIYEKIEANKLGDLNINLIPSSINPKLENSISRDKYFAIIQFSPIIKVDNEYLRVISFSYNFKDSTTLNKLTNKNSNNITNSALKTGTWKRFYVEKSGVYKISKSFLNDLGINTNNSDPRKIKIYGNGGRMAPLENSENYPIDIEENSIQFIGESDGVFNDEDYIIFYAEGLDNWSEENQTNINLYSTKSYYYVTVGSDNGKRMNTMIQPSTASTLTLSTFDDYQFHETDLTNIGKLGRIWFGEPFNVTDKQEFNFSFPNIVPTEPTNIEIRFGGNSFVATKFDTNINGTAQATSPLSIVVPNSDILASSSTLTTNVASSTNFNIKLSFDNGGVPTSKGYLDYINIKAKSYLKGFGKQFRFQYDLASNSTGIVEYQITNANGIKEIWDITDILNTSKIENNNQNTILFKANLGEAKKYIAVDFSDLYMPSKEQNTNVSNQDLKGTIFLDNQGDFKDVDYLIITPSFLTPEAEQLATFHRTNSQLNTKVVTLESIYQEFGSGKQDIAAIRNFVKYVYDNASTPSKKVKYLNLFGDASFDFKNRITNNTNIVPIYHSLNFYTTGESSFSSDDFFCYMDANEGNSGKPDIAVGRMLVSTNEQAQQMVNKVFEYNDIKAYGNWRNNYVAIADDADKSSDAELQTYQNNLTDVIYTNKPFLNFKKILLDSYLQETTAGGNRYPKAKEDIWNEFSKGALVFNYLGHGGEDGLTAERIWDKMDGYNFQNQYKYPLFITLTCEFSRFDNPQRPTAGEYTYWNPKGGAISMITTIRTIGQYTAELLNNKLAENLFSFGSDNYYSMAEALRITKETNNTKVVFYIGDPALMLAIPKPKIILTKVNNIPVSQPIDDLKALSFVTLTGEVQDENGLVLSNYTGELFASVFDKNFIKQTNNNDGQSSTISFNNLGETIFRGNASVNNGIFEFGFVVPKDIKIPVGNGRISFYSKQNQILLDKTGYNTDIKVGGINSNAPTDTTAPKVQLYMNDETFINGGITNQSPYFLAFLQDEHGINTASGIGHDLVAILDGVETNPYILNDYYETQLDDYTHGKVRFQFKNLALGLHTIVFKAWDVYNNYISAEIQFIVVGDENVSLTNVLNYPNPFVNYTQFWFTHNKPYEPLDVQVQIFTITGKIIKTINQTVITEGFLSKEISWDGKDDFGDKIGKGVYVYKLTVKSTLTNEKSEKIEKLVIL